MRYKIFLLAALALATTACTSSDSAPPPSSDDTSVVTGPPVIPPVTGDAPSLPATSLDKVKSLAQELQKVPGVPTLTFSPEQVPVDDCGNYGIGQRTVYQYTGTGSPGFLSELPAALSVKPLQNGQALADENGIIVPVARLGFDKDGLGVVVQVSSSGAVTVNFGLPCAVK